MSTAQETSNKAAFRRFQDASNTGDAEFLSKTIDELFEPGAKIRTPLPAGAAGAQVIKEVFAGSRGGRSARSATSPSGCRTAG